MDVNIRDIQIPPTPYSVIFTKGLSEKSIKKGLDSFVRILIL